MKALPVSDKHGQNGPIVAQVRRWLELRDNLSRHAINDYRDTDWLSCMTDHRGDKYYLTAGDVRVLLAEHDAYRAETKTGEPQPTGTAEPPPPLPDTFLDFVERCITGDERSIKDADLRPTVITDGAFHSGWDVYTIWDECQAKRKILANYRAALAELSSDAALAEVDAMYPSEPSERGVGRPSEAQARGRLIGAHHALMAVARLYRDRPDYRRALSGREPKP